MRSLSDVVRSATNTYLQSLDTSEPPSTDEIENELLACTIAAIQTENDTRNKGEKLRIPDTLSFAQIAEVILYLYPVKCINCAPSINQISSDNSYDVIGLYQSTGPNTGIYDTSQTALRKIARELKYSLTSKEFEEILNIIKDRAPRVDKTLDRDLIPVGNGIFNYATKTLEPFSEEKIFLSKSPVNYNPNITNPQMHCDDDGTDWDVETWMADLTDDPAITQLLWEILGAIIRPNVKWGKSAWFYSTTGNNGKGTLCELMRNLCGSYASISISDFSKDFCLEPLLYSSAVIVDENDVGTYIDKAANLKACITNDVLYINRKYKTPIACQFFGFMVQCLNEYPKIKDKSESLYRRQLFVPFNKCFTGHVRTYIKSEYLHDKDVLEYVLHKVLNMTYYKLSEPAACTMVLDEYKISNDAIRQFWDEFKDRFVWDCLPFSFVYDLYKEWYKINVGGSGIEGRYKFVSALVQMISMSHDNGGWYCKDKNIQIRVNGRMAKPEPIIAEYGLKQWKNPKYSGANMDLVCTPAQPDKIRGLQRDLTYHADATDEDTDDDLNTHLSNIGATI